MNTTSDTEGTVEIQALTDNVQHLTNSVEWWNSAVVHLMVVTAVVAGLVAAATYIVVTRGKQAGMAQAQLLAAKDRKAQADISLANERASKADEKAALASERTNVLESANLRVRSDLERATAESRARQTELEEAQGRTANAQREAAVAQLALRQSVNALVEGQRPRQFPQELVVAILRRVPPMNAVMYYQEGSNETYLYAYSLRSALVAAGWKASDLSGVSTLLPIRGGGLFGPTVEIVVGSKYPERTDDRVSNQSVLEQVFSALGLSWGNFGDDSVPEDTVNLYVGHKRPSHWQ